MAFYCLVYLCFILYLVDLPRTIGAGSAGEHSRHVSTLPPRKANIVDLLTGGRYNPMDPLGFIMKGSKSGQGGPQPMPYPGGSFIPSYNATGMFKWPTNNADVSTSSEAPDSNITGNGTLAADAPRMSELLETFMQMMNATRAYSRPSYSGRPGMLGVGSQSPATGPGMLGVGSHSPATGPGMLGVGSQSPATGPGMHMHMTGTNMDPNVGSVLNPSASINSEVFAAMLSIGAPQQTAGSNSSTIAAQNPPNLLYSGFPGMLGSEGMMHMTDPFMGRGGESAYFLEAQSTEHGSKDHEMEHDSRGHSNMDYYGYGKFGNSGATSPVGALQSNRGEFGNSNNAAGLHGMGHVGGTGLNENNWNGEWPGHKDISDKDWTGAWSNSWPQSGSLGNFQNTIDALSKLVSYLDTAPSNAH